MYLAWSMTYFHINLDPRGKKKSFAANSYTRDYTEVFFFFLFFFFFNSLNLLGSFFLSGLSKTRLQGGTWEITLQLEARGCHLWASGSGYVGQMNHLLGGGLPSSSACTVIFRCSMLTPVLFQNTSVECVSLCAQEHTPFNIVPACLPALSTSVVMSLTCFDRTLTVFIYNSIVFFFSSPVCKCTCVLIFRWHCSV